MNNHLETMDIKDIAFVSDFDNAIESDVTLVEFYTPNCNACRKQAPILNEVAFGFADVVMMLRVDIVHFVKLAREHDVTVTPTIILFQSGEEIFRFEGITQVSELKDKLSSIIE